MTNVVSFRKKAVVQEAQNVVAAEDRYYWIHDLASAAYTAAFVDKDMETVDVLLAELTEMLRSQTPFRRLPLALRERCATSLGVTSEARNERAAKLLDILYG